MLPQRDLDDLRDRRDRRRHHDQQQRHINGNISVATATFNNEAGGTWTVSGTSVFGNASSIVNHGDIDLHGASISGTGLTIENDSDIDSWGTASISGTITNTGAIEVNTGTLTLFGSLSGAGSVTIDAGATLDVQGTVSQTITFNGDGAELQIDTTSFGGSVAGFASTDKLDLSTISCLAPAGLRRRPTIPRPAISS